MEIKREYYQRENYFNFFFQEGNKTFSIIFGGNLDLYWNISETNDKNLNSEEYAKEMYQESRNIFTITKENYVIYKLFDELYSDIKESNVFIPNDNLNYTEESKEDLIKMNESYKNSSAHKLLFNKEIIEWNSDDDIYERANILKIKKEEDKFVLEFIRPKTDNIDYTFRYPERISIRFSNSGSRYNPYNIIIMSLFNKLQEYDPNYHQMDIEEVMYNKKLTLKK